MFESLEEPPLRWIRRHPGCRNRTLAEAEWLMVLLRSIGLICCRHRAIALENLALRHSWPC
jgi:hypothetical protein